MTLIKKSVFRLSVATAICCASFPMPASASWECPDLDIISISGPKPWDCAAVTSDNRILRHKIFAASKDRAEALMRSRTNFSTVHCSG
ncbi:hypothetical protein [Herbaspirillum autotrophicum]|uniref:hypothetical protein n=1 Tax=Herbaspirillum autotrophicum TaxID=180195 RepID=UPI00067BFC47|nr:hypothetical protein [Herbaspirillum autotrophicum]